MDKSQDDYWKLLEAKRKLFLKIKRNMITMSTLGIYVHFLDSKIEYRPWPDHKFYPLWAFQHQKAIRRFVAITGGDETDDQNVVETSLMLWEKDPKAVEYNWN